MAVSLSDAATWEEIELSERTSEMMDELKASFGLVTSIPVQVLLTGACFKIWEGCSSGLREIFEEFLGKWKYVDGQPYVLENLGPHTSASEGCIGCSALGIEKYLEVVEVYAVTLLGTVLGDADLAISWVERAELPEEKRQEILRRLRSLCSLKHSKSSPSPGPPQSSERSRSHTVSGTDFTTSRDEGFSRAADTQHQPNGRDTKSAILKSKYPSLERFSEKIQPCLWWFRTVTLKFGNARLVLSHGRIVLWGSLILFIYYILRRKGATLKQIASKQAASVKKALIDTWKLAFSVQVNPLAAIQPLPSRTH
ncbi:protein APEM9 isoform X2 [Magnolia sinica]|uniref:protein APEM9 isoform X2 n=1 Tax=Magnolia sinica TaxID=86752 RepID=UPI00265A379F|nr:protein APEM9 isoform X2 [Magnolia sinica]